MNTASGKKIAVVGIGGVGGYIAGMLCRVYSDITLVARGERLEALKKNGLILHSDLNGEIAARAGDVVSAAELKEQDYIFICVKNYSLEGVCKELEGAIGDKTVIIPVMNGVDPGERVRRVLRRGIVVDALIYIVSFANPDFSITQQGDFARLRIGVQDANEAEKQAVEQVSEIFKGAGIDFSAVEDIEAQIWQKYILNCAYNVATAYYDNTIGQLRNDENKAKEYEALVNEALKVGMAKGVKIGQEVADSIIYQFYNEHADGATSSLQRDIRAGKRAEVETFSGYIVNEAKRLGISVPVSRKMYDGLKKM